MFMSKSLVSTSESLHYMPCSMHSSSPSLFSTISTILHKIPLGITPSEVSFIVGTSLHVQAFNFNVHWNCMFIACEQVWETVKYCFHGLCSFYTGKWKSTIFPSISLCLCLFALKPRLLQGVWYECHVIWLANIFVYPQQQCYQHSGLLKAFPCMVLILHHFPCSHLLLEQIPLQYSIH